MFIQGEELDVYKPYSSIKRDIPDVIGVDNVLVEDITNRIKNPQKRKSIYRGIYKIYGVDIIDLLKNSTEYSRFRQYAKQKKDIRPFELLVRCIKTKCYIYKGKRLISYFNSDKKKYIRALKRIRMGWSIEEAIARQEEIISYSEAGKKGFKIMCNNKGVSKKEGVKIIHTIMR